MVPPVHLTRYDISREGGFLSLPVEVRLPHELSDIRTAALELPRTIVSGKLRRVVGEELSRIDVDEFCRTATLPQKKMAMVHYTFLVQAYVWCESEPVTWLPECLAVPVWQLAKSIGQPPLLTYANYVLDNWGLIDPSASIDLSNIYMKQPFLGGQDEAWFVLIHVAIESCAGAMLAEIPGIFRSIAAGNDDAVQACLITISQTWDDINAIFDRMPERCDPYVYFHRVRPWIHGWKDNPVMGAGLIYKGVAETVGKPQAFRGQTGSQSSIVPTMDALLGIDHAADPLRCYLDELHAYRPPRHRDFIDMVRDKSTLREYVRVRQSNLLIELYNECVMKLTRFRTRHLEYAASYVHKHGKCAEANASNVGTGGTPFMRYLKKHRDEAQAHLL